MMFSWLSCLPLFVCQGGGSGMAPQDGHQFREATVFLQVAALATIFSKEPLAIAKGSGFFHLPVQATKPPKQSQAIAKPKPPTTVNCSARAVYLRARSMEFQSELDRLQAPTDCACARRLVYDFPNTEGLMHMVHGLGFMLMTSVMSERTVFFSGETAHCAPNASGHDFFCFFDAGVAPCSYNTSRTKACHKGALQPASIEHRYGHRYLEHAHGPMAMVNGPKRSIEMPIWSLSMGADTMVHRTGVMTTRFLEMGNFWLRSQIQGWAWQLKPQIQQYVVKHPVTANLMGKKYVGIHLRTLDTRMDKPRSFSVDGESVITFERALRFAKDIRATDSQVSTIFLATDDQAVIKEAEHIWPQLHNQGWQMYWVKNAIRASRKQQTKKWLPRYRASMGLEAILDIENLRKADYLVGSMMSNVFRLAVELNSARKASAGVVDEFCNAQNYYSLDLPWYQDI